MSDCVIRIDEPKSCWGCPCADCERGVLFCTADDDRRKCTMDFRPEWCPIVTVLPEKHGRLVDADSLKGYAERIITNADNLPHLQKVELFVNTKHIEEAPTIVPATERSKE